MVQTFKKIGVGVFSLGLSLSGLIAEEQKLNVDFFPMFHPTSSMQGNPQATEQVLKSQHELMIYLQENPDSYVFVESSYETVEKDTYFDPKVPEAEARAEYKYAVELNFPQGVPFIYEQFNKHQKTIVLGAGFAINTMFQLGFVKAMLPTNTVEEFQNYVGKYVADPETPRLLDIMSGHAQAASSEESIRVEEFRNVAFKLREEAALRQIQKFAAENPDIKNVVLVYGAFHDFLKYRDQEAYADLNIRKVNTKRYNRNVNNFMTGAYHMEPRHERFRFNPETSRYEVIPGISPF